MKILVFFICAVFFCSNSCKKPPLVDIFYRIIVINNSTSDVYVHLADLMAEKQYPDTALPAAKPVMLKIPAKKRGYIDSKTTWENNLGNLPSDTLSVFFINGDVYENEDWGIIRNDYVILKRLDLSIEDLNNNKFTITYP